MNLHSIAQRFLPPAIYLRLNSSDIGKRLARGSFWSLINALAMKSATFIQAIALAHLLGITGFGEWGILLSTSATVGVFASFGLAITTTKHVAQWRRSHPDRLGRLLALLQASAFSMGMVGCLVLVLGSPLLATQVLLEPQLTIPLALIGLNVFLHANSGIYLGILNGFERFRDTAIIHAVTTFIGVALTVLLAYRWHLTGAIAGLLATSLISALAFGYWSLRVLRRNRIQLIFADCWAEWRGIWNFAIPTASAGLVVMVAIWVAHAALVRQPGGLEDMGAFQAATQWRTIVSFLPTQLLAAYLPVLSSLVSSDMSHSLALQRRVLGGSMLLALALALPVVLLAPRLMSLYGGDFAGFGAVLAVVVLIPAFDIGHIVMQKSALVYGYAWTLLLSNLAMPAAIAVGAYWLIPAYLSLGLAITLLIGYATRLAAELFVGAIYARGHR